MKQELCFAPIKDEQFRVSWFDITAVTTYLHMEPSPVFCGAERFRLLGLQSTMPCPGSAQFILTVNRSPVYRCRDSRTRSSWSATTRYLANPQLTNTHQNAKIKISAHEPTFLQNQHNCQQDQSSYSGFFQTTTIVLTFFRATTDE